METILQDVKYAIRQLGQQRSFSAVAALTLALGIGLSTAMFSVIDAALLRPLPYPHPEELVTLNVEEPGTDGQPSQYAPSPADVRTWRTVTPIVAHAGMGRVSGFVPLIVETGSPQRLTVAEASEDFLDTYGIAPVLGRGIQRDDTREGAPAVALLGHAFWQREYGGDPGVLGRDLRIEHKLVTIVGVLPAGFYADTEVWQAMQFSAAREERRASGTPVIARLRPGVTRAQASAALAAVTSGASISGPAGAPVRVVVESMYADETNGYGPTLRTLAIAVGLILVIACVNVASLLLARGASRHIELAIRAAVGAGRARLIRQLLTEGLLLAAAGAALGVAVAYVVLDSLVTLVPLTLPANSPVTINATVLGFAIVLTLLTALLSGLVPALKLSRPPRMISAMLLAGGSGGPLSTRAGQWLIAVEVALALVLLTASGLVVRSFARLVSVDLGFDVTNVLTVEVEPLEQSAAARRNYYASLVEALRAFPEVVSVGGIDQLALEGGGSYSFPRADTGADVGGPQRTVLPGYLEAMGVRPVGGRLLEESDRASGEAAIVNQETARQFFAGDAIGHTLQTKGKLPRSWRVVGVVPNLRHGGPLGRTGPEMYVLPDPRPSERSSLQLAIVMRVRDGATVPIERVKQAAEGIGPRILLGRLRPASALVGQQVAAPRHRMLLLALLGGLGLLMTLVGIFSVTAYALARRTREIGVRVACGARPAQVVRVMIRDAAWPLALGVVAGLAGAYYAGQIVRGFLFQTAPHDPAALAAAVGLLSAGALLAAWLPARRAASIDPATALRLE